jgi:pyridoxamine 5'-phosphate oxidase
MKFLEKLRCLLTFGQGVALPLPEINMDQKPLTIFEQWFYDAARAGVILPESMSVSTCSADGQPSSRMVLLKQYDQQGFVFYTNYNSRKTHELAQNQKVALLFHWGVLQRQVRIEGVVEKVSKTQSEDYFHSRSRGSQIGAWASYQSKKINNDNELKQRVKAFERKFAGDKVPLPEFWGGWRVKPQYFESSQGRASRLHDRLCFEKQADGNWSKFKLMP